MLVAIAVNALRVCDEEKPLTMRGTDVKMVLCLDTLGQQLSVRPPEEWR